MVLFIFISPKILVYIKTSAFIKVPGSSNCDLFSCPQGSEGELSCTKSPTAQRSMNCLVRMEFSLAGWRGGQFWVHWEAVALWLALNMETEGPYKDSYWEWLGKETQKPLVYFSHCTMCLEGPRDTESPKPVCSKSEKELDKNQLPFLQNPDATTHLLKPLKPHPEGLNVSVL